jgi:L-iditol 2-dehydrogenase
VVLLGIPPSDRTTFRASLARRKGISLVLARRMKGHHLKRAIALVEAGRVALSPLITHRYSLEDGPRAFQDLVERRGLKIVVRP